MQQNFYKNRLSGKFFINAIIPTDIKQDIVQRVIYQELCLGVVDEKSSSQYLHIIQNLIQKGAQGIILGCTEIGLLVDRNDIAPKLYDTTIIHVLAAVEESLKIIIFLYKFQVVKHPKDIYFITNIEKCSTSYIYILSTLKGLTQKHRMCC
ncbi:MAG: hypothetical protein ACI936_001211 [Paraglaciecola sp.]|jgi:hypothetical protein